MLYVKPSKSLPPALLREYKKVAYVDWGNGMPVMELIKRVNHVAECFAPEKVTKRSQATRVKRIFTERSFRHYQTLGCIDVPEKQGRVASYGFRHFLQALLVRRLLQERLPTEQIALMLAGRGIEELESMFMSGIEMVAKFADGDATAPTQLVEKWERVRVATGVELQFRTELARLKPAELRQVMALVEKALRKVGN
jgi:hypothetical protein